ncbi:MAG: hypothetical protein WDO70_09440 [Alphaproteobacteria bacterium]
MQNTYLPAEAFINGRFHYRAVVADKNGLVAEFVSTSKNLAGHTRLHLSHLAVETLQNSMRATLRTPKQNNGVIALRKKSNLKMSLLSLTVASHELMRRVFPYRLVSVSRDMRGARAATFDPISLPSAATDGQCRLTENEVLKKLQEAYGANVRVAALETAVQLFAQLPKGPAVILAHDHGSIAAGHPGFVARIIETAGQLLRRSLRIGRPGFGS